MLAPFRLPPHYEEFNRRHHAPDGTRFRNRFQNRLRRLERSQLRLRLAGPYAWQSNNTTRAFEYPWAHEQIHGLGSKLVIADVGASLAGLQFTLAQEGYEVHAVDPGLNATGVGWEVDPTFHQLLAETYRAPVTLHPTTFDQAGFDDGSLDVVLSVSTIEHFGPEDLDAFAQSARRALKPGGHLVLTINLFLDLVPFTDRERNRWGTNMSVAALTEALGATLVVGDPKVLYGFPEFDARQVQADLGQYMIGTYPTLTQCVVVRVGP
jgi:2-polyprenyl-3-methyl-5-hydroxy-6-metoxy-1,4-benzoquinol methylase